MSQTQPQEYIECYWVSPSSEDAYYTPPLRARFRNGPGDWALIDFLVSRQRGPFPWVSESGGAFTECEVYQVVDPGPGYFLIDPMSSEPKKGDEVWDEDDNTWNRISKYAVFNRHGYYRRPIKQPEEYVPFDWKTYGSLMDKWIIPRKENDRNIRPPMKIVRFSVAASGGLMANSIAADRLLEEFLFLDTKEPVGIKAKDYQDHVSGTAALLSEKV